MENSQISQCLHAPGDGNGPTGSMLAVLAASVPGGAVVYLGAESVEAAGALLRGIDITTRLLMVSETQAGAERLREGLSADLRVSNHVQDLGVFLEDVNAHQFAFLVCGTAAASHLEAAAALVKPGGFLAGAIGVPPISPDPEWIVTALKSPELAWLAARRARPVPKRRGGRRRPGSS